jgi:hypothetical protein
MDPNSTPPSQPVTPQPEQPVVSPSTPSMVAPPSKRSPLLIVIVVLLLLILLGGVGGVMYLKSSMKTPSQESMKQVAPSETPIATPTPTVVPVASSSASPTVTIESQATLSAQDVSELQGRVIDPFMDYYKEARPEDPLLQITIMKNVQNTVAFPYVLDSLSQEGIKQGSVISRTNGHLDWWFPECQMGCHLSDAYKAKYPEIAKKVQ